MVKKWVAGTFPGRALRLAAGFWMATLPGVRAAGPDLQVTGLFVEGDRAALVLNETLEIRDVRFTKRNNRVQLRFPEYKAKSGRVYPQVEILSRDVEALLAQTVLAGQPSPGPGGPVSFRVSDVRLIPGSRRRANARVVFNDAVSVAVGVMEGPRRGAGRLWVAYPGQRRSPGGTYRKQVVIRDAALKRSLEAAVLKSYERALSEAGGLAVLSSR
jgi:DNA-binding cell septation regulator SpoVG